MNARTRTLATSTILALVAAVTTGCERTQTPQTSSSGYGDNYAEKLSAPAAPSMVGTPIAEAPATHTVAVAPSLTDEPTARDTPMLAPGATLSAEKEKSSMPLPGQTDNHFSESAKAGTNEGATKDANAPAGAASEGSAAPTGSTAEVAMPANGSAPANGAEPQVVPASPAKS